MPQYCSKVPSKRDKFELSTTDWSQPQSKMLSSGRMKQKRCRKRRLDDGCNEVSPSAKKFISEEKMASYLQGLHIASDTHHPQQQHIGASEGSHPTQQNLLHQRLQGDNGTDEAFYSPAAINEPLLLHRSPDSSPEIRLNPPTPGSGNSSNARETKLHSLSRWDVIIEDLSSEEDDVATEELCAQPTVYLSPEARENLGKTHLLPPSIIDELCSKPCMELIPWVPKEKIVQNSLLRSVQMESSSGQSLQHIPLHNTSSINQEQIKEQLWDYSDNDMEL